MHLLLADSGFVCVLEETGRLLPAWPGLVQERRAEGMGVGGFADKHILNTGDKTSDFNQLRRRASAVSNLFGLQSL